VTAFVEGIAIEIVATLALGAAAGVVFWLTPASGTTKRRYRSWRMVLMHRRTSGGSYDEE
jgi:hypothetical protein